MEGLFVKCKFCGKEFVRIGTGQKYCKPACRERAKRKRQKEFYEKRLEMNKPYKKHSNATLCWQCQNATGGCSWSQDFTPVEGWDAKRTRIRLEKGAKYTESFIVKKCPKFRPDER